MYINPVSRYCEDGTEHIRKADFLILINNKDLTEIRAIVRKVSMEQCGHFMMGVARVKGKTISISGSYGSDGLPINEDWTSETEKAFDIAIPLPDYLHEAWNKGGGHNSAGSEAKLMAQWANDNYNALTKGTNGRYGVRYFIEPGVTHFSAKVFHHRKDAEKFCKGIDLDKKPEVFTKDI